MRKSKDNIPQTPVSVSKDEEVIGFRRNDESIQIHLAFSDRLGAITKACLCLFAEYVYKCKIKETITTTLKIRGSKERIEVCILMDSLSPLVVAQGVHGSVRKGPLTPGSRYKVKPLEVYLVLLKTESDKIKVIQVRGKRDVFRLLLFRWLVRKSV